MSSSGSCMAGLCDGSTRGGLASSFRKRSISLGPSALGESIMSVSRNTWRGASDICTSVFVVGETALLNFTDNAGAVGFGGDARFPSLGDVDSPARPSLPGDEGSTIGIERPDGILDGFGRSAVALCGLVGGEAVDV